MDSFRLITFFFVLLEQGGGYPSYGPGAPLGPGHGIQPQQRYTLTPSGPVQQVREEKVFIQMIGSRKHNPIVGTGRSPSQDLNVIPHFLAIS